MCKLLKIWDLIRKDEFQGYGEGDNFSPIWGLIIPHEKKAQGAMNYDGTYSEYNYALEMSRHIGIPFQTRDDGGVYTATERLINEYKINSTIETHFNAYNRNAHGYELLVMKGDSLSERYARLMIESFSDIYPKRRARGDAGIKWVSKGDRGYYNLSKAKDAGAVVTILSELCFGDNVVDYISPIKQAEFWRSHFIDE